MRTLRYEWKKLCGFRLLWILLLVLLCINGYVQISAANAREYSPKEYRSCVHYLQKLNPERVKPYIEKELESAFSGNSGQLSWIVLSEMQESILETPADIQRGLWDCREPDLQCSVYRPYLAEIRDAGAFCTAAKHDRICAEAADPNTQNGDHCSVYHACDQCRSHSNADESHVRYLPKPHHGLYCKYQYFCFTCGTRAAGRFRYAVCRYESVLKLYSIIVIIIISTVNFI